MKVAQQAKQVLQACERTPGDEVQLDYDSRNPFVVCAGTFVPIYRGTSSVACPMLRRQVRQRAGGQDVPGVSAREGGSRGVGARRVALAAVTRLRRGISGTGKYICSPKQGARARFDFTNSPRFDDDTARARIHIQHTSSMKFIDTPHQYTSSKIPRSFACKQYPSSFPNDARASRFDLRKNRQSPRAASSSRASANASDGSYESFVSLRSSLSSEADDVPATASNTPTLAHSALVGKIR